MGEAEDPIRLLAIEDDPTDRSWMELMLKETSASPYTLRFVGTMADAESALGTGSFHCALLDLSLPDCDGLESVRRVLDVKPGLPIVVFTGRTDQELGLRALEAGAQDYLVKGQASGNTILQAARWARARVAGRARVQSSSSALVDRLDAAWACVGPTFEIDMVNEAFLQLVGVTEPEALGRPITDFVAGTDSAGWAERLRELAAGTGPTSIVQEVTLTHRLGDNAPRTAVATPTRAGDGVDGLFLLFGEGPRFPN